MSTPRLSDYDFDLPTELIAQTPAGTRSASRMMEVVRHGGPSFEGTFADLPHRLRGDELLVFNDTRVVPARLRGHKPSGGRFELLVLESVDGQVFRALGKASKGFSAGQTLYVEGPDGVAPATVTVERPLDDGHVEIRWNADNDSDLWAFLEIYGQLPLPPYIARPDGPDATDAERYQTVYAAKAGSVAAPTAGLHFTPELLAEIAARGCATTALTLHVGPGTFAPVRTDDLDAHRMHSEAYEVPVAAADAIAAARREGRKVLAVGTTVVRTLEAVAAMHDGTIVAGRGTTDIFIREGHRFRVVEQLITNFHLPRSTLLVLVSAFAGRETMLGAYRHAVASRYRFFSYGDGMLLR